MPTLIDLTEEQLAQISMLLEELLSLLDGPGPEDKRLQLARALVHERLSALRMKAPAAYGRAAEGTAEPHPEVAWHQGLVGKSGVMQQVYRAIERVSQSHATVLIRGESGTGKELVAKAIHQGSPRADAPFIRLHCAALTESLLESELFGHERGAFTGATETRKGRFEMADRGTLFLDEIGDIPPATQIKLLRVLQEKCIERVGSGRAIPVDVRVIAATHRDLEAMIQTGEFREDLYYRLNVVPVVLPPLRDRNGDLPPLIEHFLYRFNRENQREVRLGRDLLSLMTRYHWPGNVRELQNCIERLVVMADTDAVTLETVPASLQAYFADMRQVTEPKTDVRSAKRASTQPLQVSLRNIEYGRLQDALERAGWVQARAARALGITPRQIGYKMRKYGLREKRSQTTA
jgi:Nif-specific regulatory protein